VLCAVKQNVTSVCKSELGAGGEGERQVVMADPLIVSSEDKLSPGELLAGLYSLCLLVGTSSFKTRCLPSLHGHEPCASLTESVD